MDPQTLIMIAVIAVPIVFALFWWDFRTSGCAYGGSNPGTDNWALSQLRDRIREYRRFRADREPRDVSDI